MPPFLDLELDEEDFRAKRFFYYPFPHANCVVTETSFNFGNLFKSRAKMFQEESEDWMKSVIQTDFKTDVVFANDRVYTRRGKSKILYDNEAASAGESFELVSEPPTADTSLYISGHCFFGSSELGSPDGKVTITADKLGDDLATYLPSSWQGKIKVHACYSGSANYLEFWGGQPFAKRLFDRLRKKGMKKCNVFGYTTSVSVSKHDDGKGGYHFLNGDGGDRVKLHRVKMQ